MFAECQKYLTGKLKESNVKNKPYTTFKELRMSNASHLGAVLFEEETLLKSGAKKIYQDNADKKKRRKVYDRDIVFTVVIGEYTQEAAEIIYESFLSKLAAGIEISGNYVEIIPEDAEWVDKEDSIINAKCAVQIKIIFKGGVYRDTPFAKITEVKIMVDQEDEHDNQKY